MSCPTCDHTMQGLGDRWFWCPRCGTVKGSFDSEAPKIVAAVRTLVNDAGAMGTYLFSTLQESVYRPEDR